MAVKEFPAGTQLIQSGQNLTALHVIAKGTVRATYPGGEFYLYKGDVLGVCEIFWILFHLLSNRRGNIPRLLSLFSGTIIEFHAFQSGHGQFRCQFFVPAVPRNP